MSNLKDLIQEFSQKRILVVGDLMLDHYIFGKVDRISPEAPIPVVAVESENYKLGGAGNVAMNVASLGGLPFIIGTIGSDDNATILINQLRKNRLPTDLIIHSVDKPTTIKTRVFAHSQQVVRIDKEETSKLATATLQSVLQNFSKIIKQVDAVIFEDYNKGFFSKFLIKRLINIAKEEAKPILVDPKSDNFLDFVGCTVFKPNKKEFARGTHLKSTKHTDEKGFELLEQLGAKHIVLTKSEEGLSIFSKGEKEPVHLPTFTKKVYDVSGAGDTVIATLALAYCCGASIKDASQIANYAAAIACSSVGVVPVSLQELKKELEKIEEIETK